jgi:hypothetical protein
MVLARELDLMLLSQTLCHSRVHLEERFWLKEGRKREWTANWGLGVSFQGIYSSWYRLH